MSNCKKEDVFFSQIMRTEVEENIEATGKISGSRNKGILTEMMLGRGHRSVLSLELFQNTEERGSLSALKQMMFVQDT